MPAGRDIGGGEVQEEGTRQGIRRATGTSGDPEEDRKRITYVQAKPPSPKPGGKGIHGETRGYFANKFDLYLHIPL
jgi:hypothetical protein